MGKSENEPVEMDPGWDEVPDRLDRQTNGYVPTQEKARFIIPKDGRPNSIEKDTKNEKK